VTSRTHGVRRLRVLAAAGLVAPLALGLALDVGSAVAAGPAGTHRLDPAQRYITALVNKKEVKKGKKVTIHGAIEAPVEAPACAANVVLDVERSTKGAIYKQIDTVTTDGTGAYSVQEKVTKKSRFRISAPATDACSSVQSPPRTVNIIVQR
jgi:hypothetical protein